MSLSVSTTSACPQSSNAAGFSSEARAELPIFFALCILVVNYLSFNLLGVSGPFLAVTRVAVIVLFLLSFGKKPLLSSTAIYTALACVAGIVLGGPENNIAINLAFLVFAVCCLRRVTLESIVNYSLIALFIALAATFLLLALGLTENAIDTAGERQRASFGFSNVNAFTSVVYAFVTLALYRWKIHSLVKYVVLSGVSFAAYIYTDSRTLVASIAVFVIAHGLFLAFPKTFLKVVSAGMLLLPIVLTQLSTYIAENLPLVDLVLSFRPSYSAAFMRDFSVYNYLLGGVSPGGERTIDNSFLLIQAAVGMPFLLAFALLAFRRVVESINANRPETFCLIVSFWYFSYSESSMVRPESILGLIFWLILFKNLSGSFDRRVS